MTRFAFLLVLSLLLALSGCARTIQSAFDSAGHQIGTAIGSSIGNAVTRNYTSKMKSWYAVYLIEMGFHASGSYVIPANEKPYAEGDYTRWKVVQESGPDDSWMERLYLGKDDDGHDWWQVRFYDGASMDTVIVQGLYSEDNELVRLRTQFPKDARPTEVSVDGRQMQRPESLSEQAMALADRGQRVEEVAAGSFLIREFVHEGDNQDEQTWWLSNEVPGEIVRYAYSGPPKSQPRGSRDIDASNYVLELQRYGGGERSALGSW